MFKKDRERIAELDRRAKELLAEILAALDECPKERRDKIVAFLDQELERLKNGVHHAEAFSGTRPRDERV